MSHGQGCVCGGSTVGMFLTAVVIKMCLTNAHGLRVTWRVSHLGAQGVRALLNLGGDCKAWEMQVVKTETGPALASSCQLREQFSETIQQIICCHIAFDSISPQKTKSKHFWGKWRGSFIQASSPHGNCPPDSVGPHHVGRIGWDTDLLT